MESKLLVAFDDSENAMRAVKSVARSFSPKSQVTLFHAAQDSSTLCKMNSPSLTPLFKHGQSEFCTLEDKKRELVDAAMEKAKKLLIDNGFTETNIRIKNEMAKRGIARDILTEASEGYDVIVIGRRGISGVKDFLFGGTTQKVIQGAKDISVFVVN
jgi:nucleotide-binding universal stress UspA family protein